MVTGFLPTMAAGMLGAFFSELIRVAAAFRERRPPAGVEYIASGLFIVAGAGILLYGWSGERTLLEAATLGAAFPLVFSAAVRGVTSGEPTRGSSGRSILDYLASRF